MSGDGAGSGDIDLALPALSCCQATMLVQMPIIGSEPCDSVSPRWRLRSRRDRSAG